MSQTKGQKGVGFLVKKHLKGNIIEIRNISERIAVLKMNWNEEHITIIQVYAPTESSSEDEIEDFYSELDLTFDSHRSGFTIILGDFNSKIGIKQGPWENAFGPYGYGQRNERGTRLIKFAAGHNLKIVNTFFNKTRRNKWTWRSPDGKTKNEIDFMLTNRIGSFINLKVIDTIKFNSDHRMIMAKIRLITKRQRRPYNSSNHFKTNNIDFNSYKIELKHQIETNPITDAEPIQENYLSLINCITKAGEKSKTINNKRRGKLSKETLKLLEERESLRKNASQSEEKKREYQLINKITKREIRKDLRKYRSIVTQEIIDSTKSVKKLKKELNDGKYWMLGTKNAKGKMIYKRDKILEEATAFYSDLYTSKRTTSNEDWCDYHHKYSEEETVAPIITSEVRSAIEELKTGKTPGEDGILNEMLKQGADQLTNPLTKLFNRIINEEIIPNQWTTSIITLLHKKGPRNNLNNYRPISLISNMYKLFSKIITRRITKVLDENQPIEQAGFRSGYSTADHLQTINQVMEKVEEFNLKLYIAFIDYNKAFDSIEHFFVLKALQQQGIQTKYINILEKLYSNSWAKIQTEKLGETFRISRGVKQGDPISPKLFSAVLEQIFRKLKWDNRFGININGRKLSHLRFADDIVLFAKSANELQIMMKDLWDHSKTVGLSMNEKKTVLMTNHKEREVVINGVKMSYVNKYIYLGQTVTFHNRADEEVEKRTTMAWNKFWSLSFILLDKNQKMDMKKKIMDSCVLPVMLYGAQTWSLTEKQKKKLAVCQRKMERKIMGINLKQKIRNDIIRKKTRVMDVLATAKKLKWKWGGHVARMEHNRWAMATTIWDPRIGKRSVGRQKTRWCSEFQNVTGTQWTRAAQDRQWWKKKGEDL